MAVHLIDDGAQYTIELTLPGGERGRNNLTVYVVAKTFEQAVAIIHGHYDDPVIHKVNKTGNYWIKHVLLVDDSVFE